MAGSCKEADLGEPVQADDRVPGPSAGGLRSLLVIGQGVTLVQQDSPLTGDCYDQTWIGLVAPIDDSRTRHGQHDRGKVRRRLVLDVAQE